KIYDVIKNEVLKLLDAGLIYPISDSPWEKSHFMVKEGIVLGHKISKERIEVDKAKVDVIAKLPHPTTVKGIRSFLGHASFYRRKLTEASILIAPDWDFPFELMCDASDFAIGAVLGQRQEKNFRPRHYTSKTMTKAESNYTTTETKMLAVELKICEAKTDKSLIDEPPEVELKDLPPYIEYSFLEGDDKLHVIIANDLSVEEKTALITEDFKPMVQHQRRVNPKIYDVIKNEVLKLLDAGLIYPISDSPWEKSHFMVKEGIVLGHKISKERIEVDKAKVDVIAKLPHPTTVKGIRSFLGHANFY
nr:hypothetical protein [Tanacetum cinerariifolium]